MGGGWTGAGVPAKRLSILDLWQGRNESSSWFCCFFVQVRCIGWWKEKTGNVASGWASAGVPTKRFGLLDLWQGRSGLRSWFYRLFLQSDAPGGGGGRDGGGGGGGGGDGDGGGGD